MVYEPAEDSYMLAKIVKKHAYGSVLDMGSGSGIQAVAASSCKRVTSVTCVDKDPEALAWIKREHGLKCVRSDLFSHVKGLFDTIVFNPPYLPQDEGIEDMALYGGKKGYEVIVRFIADMGSYLNRGGQVLLLFSSFSHKDVVDAALRRELYAFEEVACESFFMEKLYVYRIHKEHIRDLVESRGVKELVYLDKGKRGLIFVGKRRGCKVAIKIRNPKSEAIGRLENEATFLQLMNKKGIGPRFVESGRGYLMYSFVEGEFILDYLDRVSVRSVRSVLLDVLKQCYVMDQAGVNKEEMHHPWKHVLVQGNKAVMIDFERMRYSKKVHNVTQWITGLSSGQMQRILKEKGMILDVARMRKIGKQYGSNSRGAYDAIVELIRKS